MHEGHRQRMYEKLCRGEDFYDHEVLEILLYYVCPRKNTNPIAHALLDRFCSLSGVFSAPAEELMLVNGIGETAAKYLRTVGYCMSRSGKVEGVAILKNSESCKKLVSLRLNGKTEEFLELYFLEKSGRVKRVFSYTTAERNKVATNAEIIISNIALSKPYAIVAAHNHLNGSSSPSRYDVEFTCTLQLICSMNGVKLFDHFIYAGEGDIYSFKGDGRLDGIARKYSLGGITEWIKNSES